MRTAWLLVIVAGLLETGFAVSLKLSEGFSKPLPSVSFVVCAIGSFALLSTGLRELPVGPAYAVWTGIGAAGTALVGIVLLGESTATLKLLSLLLIVAGVVGLQLTSEGAH